MNHWVEENTMENADVVIVGSSVAGLMTAAYLKQQLPTMHVVVLGPSPEDERRPYGREAGGPSSTRWETTYGCLTAPGPWRITILSQGDLTCQPR